jgi:hypothetical protein
MVGEAFVRVRPDTKTFGAEAKRGISGGLRSVAGIAGIGIGVAAVVSEIRKATAAAKEAQTIQLQAAAALKTTGNSWEQYGDQVEAAANQQAKLQAFDDEEVVQGFTRIVRNVKDVKQSLELTALAGDLATARMTNGQRDLAGAALIVAKVAGGNVGILRRYGITLKDGATASEALAALQQKVAGSAEAFASGAEGAQAKLNKVWGDTQEIVGGALLPTITDLSNRVGEYLQHANETGETQRRVNEAMKVTGEVVRGVADGIDLIRTVTGPAIEAVGGVENAVKILVAAFAISKVVKFAGAVRGVAASFAFIAASSRRTTIKVVEDAAIAEAALDTAYRPRSVIVTPGGPGGTGGPILGPDGKPLPRSTPKVKPSKATRLGRFVRRIPGAKFAAQAVFGSAALKALVSVGLAAGTVATIEAIAILTTPGSGGEGGDERKYPFVMALVAKVQAGERLTKDEIAAVKTLGNKSVANLSAADLRALNGRLAAAAGKGKGIGRRPEEGAAQRARDAAAKRPTKAPPKRTGPSRLTFKQVEARLEGFGELRTDAQIARSRSGELTALKKEEAFLVEQLKDTKRSAEQRRQLKDALLSAQNEISGIESEIASENAAAVEKRVAARKAAAERASSKRDAAIKARLDAFDRQVRQARLANDGAAELKALDAEAAFLRKQISQTKKGSERRGNLQDELLKVQADAKKLNDKGLSTSATQIEKDLRAAGISTAAQITAKITGQDPGKLGVFATGAGARGSSTSSGSSSVTGSVNTITVDQLLRDLAVGQAQRDALALREQQETNRLLRIIAPGSQTPQPKPRGRNIDGLTGIGQTRETATATGGLP